MDKSEKYQEVYKQIQSVVRTKSTKSASALERHGMVIA
jgi:hypothetical protein